MARPNVLFVMTDQQRFDTIAALGSADIHTPNLDRLVRRGVAFTKAYTTCPVCVAARYSIRTGRFPPTTRSFTNGILPPAPGQAETMEGRCGGYLARTMGRLGYRTFGIGKFHSNPRDEDLGYELHLHSEELYGSPEARAADDYAAFIAQEHPEFDFIEALMGERTEMYYVPQMSPLPAALGVEAWAADRAVAEIARDDGRPFFGMVSFIGPHPPFAPPIPYNRMYDPDRMPGPVAGRIDIDHMDEQIPWMNRLIWADDISDGLARILRARYYGEISYIDDCLGRMLDAVDARGDADDTMVCFFADHGDHLGDHHAWQKESFFEAACRVPMLVSWPARLPGGRRCDELACLADLFGLATSAAGEADPRDGADLLGILGGSAQPRDHLVAYYGAPGGRRFKVMVRDRHFKYIFLANGGREQLFNVTEDPHERRELTAEMPQVARRLRSLAVQACDARGAAEALEAGGLRAFGFEARPAGRIYQFAGCRGVTGFPEQPADALGAYRRGRHGR